MSAQHESSEPLGQSYRRDFTATCGNGRAVHAVRGAVTLCHRMADIVYGPRKREVTCALCRRRMRHGE